MKFFCANIGFVRSDLQRAAFLWYSYRKMTQALNPAINLIIVLTIEIVNFSKNHINFAHFSLIQVIVKVKITDISKKFSSSVRCQVFYL